MKRISPWTLAYLVFGMLCPGFASAQVSPNPATAGKAVTVIASINLGKAASGTMVDFWFNNSAGTIVGSSPVDNVTFTSGQSTTVTTTYTLPSTLPSGTYTVNATIFTNSTNGTPILETPTLATFTVGAAAASCTFNSQTIASGSSVTAYLASSVPSGSTCTSQARTCTNGTLSGTYAYASCSVAAPPSNSVTPNPAPAGQAVTVTANINLGKTASGTMVDFWFNNSAGTIVGSSPVDNVTFTSGQSTTVTTTYTLPSTLPTGPYTVNATIFTNSTNGTPILETPTLASFTVSSTTSVPVAAMSCSPTSGTAPLTVSCSDQSKNDPTGWSWSFGDGTTSTAENPTHTFTAAGVYTVTMNASNSAGTSSAVTTSIDAQASSIHSIKWNPGHYLASGGIITPYIANTVGIYNSDFIPYELAAVNNPAIVGYRVWITWGELEPTEGNYDFSVITSLLNYLQTQYSTPRHLVLVVLPGSFTSTNCYNDGSIPSYILSNSAYGPSPEAGYFGYWGGHKNTAATCEAAIYRPAVLGRWIALHQALGAAFDANPNFEAIMFQEDAYYAGNDPAGNDDPTYPGDAGLVSALESQLTSTLAAFPHTSVIEENSYLENLTLDEQFEQWMIEHRVVPGSADSWGQTWFDSNSGFPSAGMDAYAGITATGSTYAGPDYRPDIHSMLDVETPDMVNCWTNSGGTQTCGILYSPQDICNALNQSYKASHAFWTWLGNASTVPAAAQWSNLVSVLNTCPLTNSGYPAYYP